MRLSPLPLALLLLASCSGGAENSTDSAAVQKPGDAGYVEEDPKLAQLVGKPGPAIAFRTLDGQQVDLASRYGTRPVYLKLWATYCIPCRVQMPKFQQLFTRYKDRVDIIGVDVGFGEDAAKVQRFAHDHGLTMPMAMDDGSLSAWLGMDGTPVHLVIDRDGRVAFAGHQDGPALDAALEKVASGASQGPAVKNPAVRGAKVERTAVLRAGEALPPLPLIDAAGKAAPLPLKAGRPTAILLTATWCETYLKDLEPKRAAACRAGREAVMTLAAAKGRDWYVVVSHLWTKPADLPAFARELGPNLPVVMDNNGALFRTLGVQQFPAVALIDAQGRLERVIPADTKLAAALAD